MGGLAFISRRTRYVQLPAGVVKRAESNMKKRLSSIFVLIAFASGVAAGMPLHSGGHAEMMGCCEKAKGGDQSPAGNAARLCCAVNCTDPAGTPSGSVASFQVVQKPADFNTEWNRPLLPVNRVFRVSDHPSASRVPGKGLRPLFLRYHSFLI